MENIWFVTQTLTVWNKWAINREFPCEFYKPF